MLSIFETLGIATFAISGVIEAERRGMDFVGAYAIAFLTALGGGTLRDLLLNRHPLLWVDRPGIPLLIFGIALLTVIVLRFNWFHLNDESIVIPDALGLGLFSATGASIALQVGVSPVVAVLMGVITATFGGVLRDIACNVVPVIFRRGQLYATCAFFASLSFVVLESLGAEYSLAVLASVVIAAALRLWAVWYDVKLPL